jgi:phage portal protein BeeE
VRKRAQLALLEAKVAELEAAAGPGQGLSGPVARPRPSDIFGGGFLGGSWSTVTRDQAMSVPVLAFIRHQLAGGLASMPLLRFRKTPDPAADPVEVDPGWCQDPDPAPAIPTSVFWAWVVDDLFFNGHSTLVVLSRDSAGFPVAFRRVLPGQVTYDPQTLAWGSFWPAVVFYMGREIPGEDLIVISGPTDGICNYGAQTILAALDLEATASTSAATPMPNVDLHQTSGEPLSQSAADDLISRWQMARAMGATAYTPQNLEARAVGGWSAAEMELVAARQYQATQLARLAGVNPVLVSAATGSSSAYTYTNQGDYRQAFLDDVLDTYLRAIEGRLSAGDVTPRGQYVEFDRDEFTSMPKNERVQVFVGALRAGATPEMVNALADALGLDFDMAPPSGEPVPDPNTPAPPPPPARVLVPPPTGGP